MNTLRALLLIGLDIVIAICTEHPMEQPKSASQRALEADLRAFLTHAGRHGGPDEHCVNCKRFRSLIQGNEQTVLEPRS